MTRRKKIIIGILLLVLGGLIYFEGRRVTFSLECLVSQRELKDNFVNNRSDFYNFIPLVINSSPLQFKILSKDTVFMIFQDSSVKFTDLLVDSNYTIGPALKSFFRINNNGCLEVINKDTIIVCNNNWRVQFYGHYKDKRIDNLLSYCNWTRQEFEKIVEKVQLINCQGFSNEKGSFGLNYKRVAYYKDGRLNCFGHHDGYFDYLFTRQPDSFLWKSSLNHYEENFYGIEHWDF